MLGKLSISRILREGLVVSIRVDGESNWHQSVVHGVEDHLVTLSLAGLPDGATAAAGAMGFAGPVATWTNVATGTNMVIKYANEYFEYLFEGPVSSACFEFPPYMRVFVQRGQEIVNTRAFFRYDTHLPCAVRPVWDDFAHPSVVTNISLGGMAFRGPCRLTAGDEAEVAADLGENRVLNVRGKIVRGALKQGMAECSMQFSGLDPDAESLLSEFLFSLEQERKNLQDHFYKHIKPYIQKQLSE